MKRIAVLFVFVFGLFLIGISETLKDFKKGILIESSDTISFEGKKYIITYNTKKSKYSVKVGNDMKMTLSSNAVSPSMFITSFVCEVKANGVFSEIEVKGKDLNQILYLLPKGGYVFITKITGKDEKGNAINNGIPGFKLTSFE